MTAHPYNVGAAVVALERALREKQAGNAELSYGLKGKLHFSQTGWLLLSVPNALGRGAFDALGEQGVELPFSTTTGGYNAHISVMRPEEINRIPGGGDAITERGHEFSYTLGRLRTVTPDGWPEMDRVWFIEVHSPELERLRRSYGLESLPGGNKFHISIAVRRKKVLRENSTSKAASLIHYPELSFHNTLQTKQSADAVERRVAEAGESPAVSSEEPTARERVRQTDHGKAASSVIAAWRSRGLSDEAADYAAARGDDPAKVPLGEICPHCGERLEYNSEDEKCNHCGKSYPPEKLADARKFHHDLKKALGQLSVKELIEDAVTECETPKSEEQAQAGNYKKGHLTAYGIPITIETGKGMTRSGTSKAGKKWSTKMRNSYGYIKATESEADGDHIDVFLNDDDPIYEKVFVVDQVDPETGDFDEHKCMLFFANAEEAKDAYLSNYEKDWQGCGDLTEMSLEEFKDWCASGDTSKALGKKLKKEAAAALSTGAQWLRSSANTVAGDGAAVDQGNCPQLPGGGPPSIVSLQVDRLPAGDCASSLLTNTTKRDRIGEKNASPFTDSPLRAAWLQLLTSLGAESGKEFQKLSALLTGTQSVTVPCEKSAGLLPSVQLQPQQARVADEVRKNRVRKLLFHSLGSGKTLASIATAETAGGPYVATVPAALRPNFQGEQARFTDQKTPSIVQSYNALAKQQPPGPVETALFDEAHRLRNPESQQTQQAKILAQRAKNVLLLSGSPIVNSPGDFAPLQEMLTGQPTDPKTFESTYVGQKTVRPSLLARLRGVKPAKVPVLRNQEQLKKQLAGHIDYHAPATPDVEQLEERYTTSMSPEQTKLYQAFWDQLPWILRWKLQHEFPLSKQEIGNLSSFLSGPRQVSLSTLPFMRGKRDAMKAFNQSPKLQRAVQLAQETLNQDQTAKIVAFSNFLEAGLQPYAAALAAKKIPHAIFHGGMSDAERKKAVADYNANRIRALLIAPAGSEGISLKGTNTLQLLDPHWNEARLDQAIGRGIRFDSHTHLPPEQRKVRVQRFLSELPPGVLSRLWRWAVQTKPGNQMSNPGTDFYLERMSKRKQELNDQFLNLLKDIGMPKTAATGSFYLDAVAQTPVNFQPREGILNNIKQHLAKIRARGDRAIGEAQSFDRFQAAMDPNHSTSEFLATLRGKQPLVSHPVDVLLHG